MYKLQTFTVSMPPVRVTVVQIPDRAGIVANLTFGLESMIRETSVGVRNSSHPYIIVENSFSIASIDSSLMRPEKQHWLSTSTASKQYAV